MAGNPSKKRRKVRQSQGDICWVCNRIMDFTDKIPYDENEHAAVLLKDKHDIDRLIHKFCVNKFKNKFTKKKRSRKPGSFRWERIRKLRAKYGNKCWLCNEIMTFEKNVILPTTVTLDHVSPLSCGGEDTLKNLKLAHRYCNKMCGNRSYTKCDISIKDWQKSRYIGLVRKIENGGFLLFFSNKELNFILDKIKW